MAVDVIIISLYDARVHVQSSVNAYIALGQEYFLCLFHKEKAILDYLSGQLLLTGTEDMRLIVIMRGVQMLARSVSKDKMLEGWKIWRPRRNIARYCTYRSTLLPAGPA